MEEEINIMDYLKVIRKRKKIIQIIVPVSVVASVIISLWLPLSFKAETVIMPVYGSSGGRGGALASLGGIAALATGGVLPTQVNDQLMALLKSRTLAEDIIERLDLQRMLLFKDSWNESLKSWKGQPPNMEDTVAKLQSLVQFNVGKEKTIGIEVICEDRKLAPIIANEYSRGLQDFINHHTLTLSKQNRIFIESQLLKNKKDLLEAGKELIAYYQNKNISSIEPKINVDLGDEIVMSGDLKMVLMNTFFPEHVLGLQGKQKILVEEKNEIEKKVNEFKTVKDVPQQVYFQYLEIRQRLLGEINSLLHSQYEMAKIEENKEGLSFQVIDRAKEPMRRFKPQRKKIVVMTFLFSLVVSCLIIFLVDYIERWKSGIKV